MITRERESEGGYENEAQREGEIQKTRWRRGEDNEN